MGISGPSIFLAYVLSLLLFQKLAAELKIVEIVSLRCLWDTFNNLPTASNGKNTQLLTRYYSLTFSVRPPFDIHPLFPPCAGYSIRVSFPFILVRLLGVWANLYSDIMFISVGGRRGGRGGRGVDKSGRRRGEGGGSKAVTAAQRCAPKSGKSFLFLPHHYYYKTIC